MMVLINIFLIVFIVIGLLLSAYKINQLRAVNIQLQIDALHNGRESYQSHVADEHSDSAALSKKIEILEAENQKLIASYELLAEDYAEAQHSLLMLSSHQAASPKYNNLALENEIRGVWRMKEFLEHELDAGTDLALYAAKLERYIREFGASNEKA
jgi:uncharacterized membrane-anchored protein YhcB (DUF1043 family)